MTWFLGGAGTTGVTGGAPGAEDVGVVRLPLFVAVKVLLLVLAYGCEGELFLFLLFFSFESIESRRLSELPLRLRSPVLLSIWLNMDLFGRSVRSGRLI